MRIGIKGGGGGEGKRGEDPRTTREKSFGYLDMVEEREERERKRERERKTPPSKEKEGKRGPLDLNSSDHVPLVGQGGTSPQRLSCRWRSKNERGRDLTSSCSSFDLGARCTRAKAHPSLPPWTTRLLPWPYATLDPFSFHPNPTQNPTQPRRQCKRTTKEYLVAAVRGTRTLQPPPPPLSTTPSLDLFPLLSPLYPL